MIMIKYSAIKTPRFLKANYPDAYQNTIYKKIDENSITRDGQLLEFHPDGIKWDESIKDQTNRFIKKAERINGTLYIDVKLFYTGQRPKIADGEYHELEE